MFESVGGGLERLARTGSGADSVVEQRQYAVRAGDRRDVDCPRFVAQVCDQADRKRMVDDVVSKVYEGSTMSLVMQALASGKATPAELSELRTLIDQLERDSDAGSGNSGGANA